MNSKKINQLEQLFTNRGFNPVIGDIYKQQEKWKNWYRGDVNDFHYYKIKTVGGSSVDKKKPSLQMAKKVCEDWAGLLFNENSKVLTEDIERQEHLDMVLEDNYFGDEIVNFIELSFMNGTGVLIEYQSKGKTKVNMVYGDLVMVLSYENTTATQISVIQEFSKKKKHYTHITYHLFENDIYTIEHEMYESNKQVNLGKPTSLNVLFDDKEIARMEHKEEIDGMEVVRYFIQYETKVPHFQIFKPSITNNFDVGSPMGISIFANALTPIGGVDNKYNSWQIDNEDSRKKIFVDDESTRKNKQKVLVDGEYTVRGVKYVDKDQTVFQSLDLGEEKMKIYSPDYDATQHELGIKMDLNLIGFHCGLGTTYYNFDNGTVYVNEKNVLSSTSDLWRNRQKNINKLKSVLERMAYSIMFLEDDLGNITVPEETKYTVMIDDSMIEDDASKLIKLKGITDDGYAPKYLYTMAALKINKEEAIAYLKEVNEEDNNAFNFVVDDEE